MNITNNDIISFYSDKEAILDSYTYTCIYQILRQQCEQCGKRIQSANKTFNVFKLKNKNEKVRKCKDLSFLEYLCDDKNLENMQVFTNLNPDEIREMITCTDRYEEYNEKWHLFIAYYAMTEYDTKTNEQNFAKLDESHIITNWNLKGRRSINDPLLLLWMTEAAGVEVPKRIRDYIDEISKSLCQRATVEDDKAISKMFDEALWKQVSCVIKRQ